MYTNSSEVKESFENQLVVDETAKEFLKIASKWTRFLSILGFVACGIAVLGCLLVGFVILVAGNYSEEMSYALGNLPVGLVSSFYFAAAILYGIYFIPIYYLYNFSSKIKTAIFQNNSLVLTDGFRFLKSHFKFVGIFTIVLIAIYIFALIGLILFSMSQTFNAY